MKKLNNQGFTFVAGLLIVVIIGLFGFAGYYVYNEQSKKSEQSTTSPQSVSSQSETVDKIVDDKEQTSQQQEVETVTLTKGTFGDSGEYGTVQVEGYPTISAKNEAFCLENCQQYDYVFFNIKKTENTNILNYINSQSGNSFVRDKAIGIGCIANGEISYYNLSTSRGMQEYKLSKDDTTKIMNATSEKPVVLELEKLPYSGGRGAPTCTSHFTTITPLN